MVRALLERKSLQSMEIAGAIQEDPDRVDRLLVRMRDEGLVREDRGGYYIP
jgi:DNA-binding IclR family transcriptional regulator